MPAPPEITVTLNEEHFARLCTELGIKKPVNVQLVRAKDDRVWGDQLGDRIRIYYGVGTQQRGRLLFVVNQVIRTLLHETRHVWQDENWTNKQWDEDARYTYNIKPSELDADDFADRNLAKYRGLARVQRTAASQLGRLARAERAARS